MRKRARRDLACPQTPPSTIPSPLKHYPTMQPSPQDPKPSPPKTERKSSGQFSASSPRFGYQPFTPAVSSFLHKAKDFAHDLTHKEKRKSGDHPAQKGQGEQVARHDEPAVQGAGRDGFGKNQYETGKHEGREPM